MSRFFRDLAIRCWPAWPSIRNPYSPLGITLVVIGLVFCCTGCAGGSRGTGSLGVKGTRPLHISGAQTKRPKAKALGVAPTVTPTPIPSSDKY